MEKQKTVSEIKELLNGTWITSENVTEFPKAFVFNTPYPSLKKQDNKYWFFWGEQNNRYFIFDITNNSMTLGCVTDSGSSCGNMTYARKVD